jgi:hypothetical protein
MGYNLGRMLKDSFRVPPVSKKTIEFGQACSDIVKQYAPGIIEEVQGIALGGDFDFETLPAFILTLGYEYEQIGCSIFAVSAENTTEHVSFFARNYDWFESFQPYFTANWLKPLDKYAICPLLITWLVAMVG